MKSVVVVIPTKNEESTIEGLIVDVKNFFTESSKYSLKKIIVVDDSSDRTGVIAQKNSADVIFGGGRGLGYAMLIGLKSAVQSESDYILSLDSDGQVNVNELSRFFSALDENHGDLILASRFKKNDSIMYRYPPINRSGVRALVWTMNHCTGLNITDSHGGIRAMRSIVAEKLEMIGHYTYVQETIIDAVEKGFRVHELESEWKVREHGESVVLKSIPMYAAYTAPVLLYRSKFHKRYLFPLSLILLVISLCFVFLGHFFNSLNFFALEFWLVSILSLNIFLFSILFEIVCNLLRETRNGKL